MLESLQHAGESLRDLVRDVVRKVRRLQPVPALARLVAGLMAVAALAIAAPGSVLGSPRAGLFVPVGLLVALFPRTRFVTVAAVCVVLLWLLTTIGEGVEPTLLRVGLLATALFLMHSAAAFAAVLPYDASVAREVLVRWTGRVSLITVGGVAVGLAGQAMVGLLQPERSLIGPVVGSVVAVLLVYVLAAHLRRR